jgi:hypothetical protein
MRERGARRAVLAAGAAAVLASTAFAQPRVGGEVTASGYGGGVSGETGASSILGCGSTGIARATLGGGGLRARLRVRESPGAGNDQGLVAEAQGAVEYRAHALESPGEGGAATIPEDTALVGGSLSVGYEGRVVAFHAGALVRQEVDATPDRCPPPPTTCALPPRYTNVSTRAFPQGSFRAGRLDRAYFELGAGAHDPSLVLRPWAYAGLHVALAPRAEIALRIGPQWTFGNNAPVRFDVAATIPLGRRVALGLGAAAVVSQDANTGGDGRASLDVRFKP